MALRVGSFSSIAGSLASVSAGTTNFAGKTTQRFSFDAVSVRKPVRLVSVRAGSTSGGKAASGISFEPFRDMLDLAFIVPTDRKESLARQRFVSECEVAINEQINVEYSVSYIYHALFAYFDRDNVALPGFAKYFKEASEEEREHAEKLMKYQNKRGGKVVFLEILAPPTTDFSNEEKGDALATMELALTLEKITMEKLYALHKVAEDACDVQLVDYIESEFLSEQVEAIKKVSEYVSQLRRIGKDGHGIYHFDRILGEEDA